MAVSGVKQIVDFCEHDTEHKPLNLTPVSIYSPFEGFCVGYENPTDKSQIFAYKIRDDKDKTIYKLGEITMDNVCGCSEFKLERELYGFKGVSNGIDALKDVYGEHIKHEPFLKRNVFLASRAINREVALRRHIPIPIFFKYKDTIRVGQIYHRTVDFLKFIPFTAFDVKLNDSNIWYILEGYGITIHIAQDYTNPIFDIFVDICINRCRRFHKAIRYEGRMSLIELVKLITNNKIKREYLKDYCF